MSDQRKSCSNCKYAEVCDAELLLDEFETSKFNECGFCVHWQPIPDLEPCLCERVLEAVVSFLRRLLDAVEFKLLDLIWKWLYRK